MIKYLPCLLLAVIFSRCQKDENVDLVTIRIKIPTATQTTSSIDSYVVFSEKKTISQTTLDSLGEGFLKLNISHPQFVYYEIGELRGQLYLEPGYELTVQLKDDQLEILGNGSAITNYFKRTASIEDSLIHSQEALYFSQGRFLNRLDSLDKRIQNFHLDFVRKNKMTESQTNMLQKVNSIQLNLLKAIYSLINNKKWPSGEMKMSNNKSLLDPGFLELNLSNYSNLLFWYFQDTYYNGNTGTELITEAQILNVNEKILKDSCSIVFKEIFTAQNVKNWMFDHGITPALDSMYQTFQKTFPNSPYQSQIDKNYAKYDSIAPGKIAPNFKGTTIEGDTISLNDLKGKIVYVDVWATWCAPCIEQFPHSIALKEKLRKNRSDVDFIYISIDLDKAKWKEFLIEGKAPKGIHILNNDSFADLYYVNFTPRYMLIDREGKIISAYAPRPSTDGLAEVLEKL